MKTNESVREKESERDIRQRHDELCKLFIQMQKPMELSEEAELQKHEEEQSLNQENNEHRNIGYQKGNRVNSTQLTNKGKLKFKSNTTKATNLDKKNNVTTLSQSQEQKGLSRNFTVQRRSSKINSNINKSTLKSRKSSMDTKTLMLLAKNYQYKSLPPVFTEAGSTFNATQSSLRNVRDTLIHLTYDYSNSNEVALPMLTLQAIEESHKQFLHKLHPLSEEEKSQREKQQKQKEHEKEKYYEEKYKEQQQQHIKFEKEEQDKKKRNSWIYNSDNKKGSKKSIKGIDNNNILSALLAEEEMEEETNNTGVHDNNDDNHVMIDKDTEGEGEEESIHAILELSSSNATEWDMYVKRARVVAADEFGQQFNPYQNSSLFMATNDNNNNNNNNNNKNNKYESINYQNKKSVTTTVPPSQTTNTKGIEHTKSTHGLFSSSVTSSTSNVHSNNNIINSTTTDVMNSIVNDPYFDDECASMSDYAAEPTLNEFHDNEFDIFANTSVSSNSSSSLSSFSLNDQKEQTEVATSTFASSTISNIQEDEKHKLHEHHYHTKHNQKDKKKKKNVEKKSKDVTEQSEEVMNVDSNDNNNTVATSNSTSALPFNAPNFLTNDLQLMQIEFAKVIRGLNKMMYINSFSAEWWNSATQTRRMKLNAIRSNYHARHASKLNDRIRQHLLLHAYYLNHYSARIRMELVQQQRQLRLFDDRFAESEQQTLSLLHEVNTLQRELQEEYSRRVHLQEEMRSLVKENLCYEQEEEELSENISEAEQQENEVNMKTNANNHNIHNIRDTNTSKESVDDPLRIELLLLLQNFPFPPELNTDVVAVQKWLQHNPQCCLS